MRKIIAVITILLGLASVSVALAANTKPVPVKIHIGTAVRVGYSILGSPASTNCVNPGDFVSATFTFKNTSTRQGLYFQAQPGYIVKPQDGDVDGIILADGTSRLIPTPDGARWVFGIAPGHTVVKRLRLLVGLPNLKVPSSPYTATVIVYKPDGPTAGDPMIVSWTYCSGITAPAV